ncbi:hypothetical protein [Janthinobacterium sp. FW305-128]|uniref:hypothetical protein n=1 Tax=Janthinobacterium sp. FW305-128 TaxID=2775055 RepID=UPI001E4BC39C|nr:hypothetical protein [Janthinobacterium sp. FW305-128]MCC7684598.1 hypothetical protein [Janthinobacterium sp. FW305-128]
MTINNGELIMGSDFAGIFWYLFKISEIDRDVRHYSGCRSGYRLGRAVDMHGFDLTVLQDTLEAAGFSISR